MRFKSASSKSGRLLFLCATFLATGGAAWAGGFGVTAERLGTNLYLEYDARTDAYYRVFSANSLGGPWVLEEFQLGLQSTQSWVDLGVVAQTQKQFYKIGRIWLTNSLDYDSDYLSDAYELAHTNAVDLRVPDSDRDGVLDGEEYHIYKTSPSSPYNGASVYYTFDTNLQSWTSEDWGNGHPVMYWTNVGYPHGGAMVAEPTYGGSYGTNDGQYYLKDGDVVDNKNAAARPVYRVWAYVPSGAPLDPGDAVHIQLWARSSSDGWSVSPDHYSGFLTPQPGEWTLLEWDVSSTINTQALRDVDEWGVKVQWNNRSYWRGPVIIDTIHSVPYLPPTNSSPGPVITSVVASAASVGRYEKLELTVGLTNVLGLNPYDPDDVNLEATFTSPTGQTWKIWGFYMEDPGDDYGEGKWRVRFAPGQTGTWSYVVRVSNALGTNTTASSNFMCTAGARHGWLRVSDEDSHYLEQDDDTPFLGMGYCRCWDCDDEGIFAEAEEHGINMIHWWMAPWDTMLTVEPAYEWESWRERATYYTYEQGRAGELDRVVGYAEKHNVKLVWTIWPHDAIRDFNHHKWRINGSWQVAFDHKFSEPEWYINAFSKLDTPPKNQKFFHDARYKKYQEHLYRYIIARWGYSQAIGMWALVSEMFGTFANSANCIDYQDPLWVTNKVALFGEDPYDHMDLNQCDGKDHTIEWLTYANSYFKTNDPFRHPTTASYATDEYWEHGFPVVDVPQIHTYADLYSWLTPPVTLSKYHHFLREEYDKPAFMGEIGTVDWQDYEPDYTRVTTWPALCSGAAMTPLMWTTPPFSLFGDSKMGPWLEIMSDEVKILSRFTQGIDFKALGFAPADVQARVPNEPPITRLESWESGLNGWSKHGAGVTSVEIVTNHATHGAYSLRLNVDIPTWSEMPNPEPGIEKYDMNLNWATNYWPHGTLKMDVYLPEFYHPEDNPDGFLLGINKDPRSIFEVHCQTNNGPWKWYSTTNQYANEGGWKKLTVGMLWNLELNLNEILSSNEAANIKGIKFKFGDAGILKGPLFIDNITVGLYPFNVYGMVSSNKQLAFAWIQDRQWTNRPTSNNTFQVNGLLAGTTYNLEWWNTITGPYASFNAGANATGTLVATIPSFTKDVAVKIRRVGSGVAVHDVAVGWVGEPDWMLKATTQKVSVLLLNQGTTSETFNVTLTDATDSRVIGTNSVTVTNGGCLTTSFTWNNTNATVGVHTLVAQAAAVPGETDTADNAYTGRIKVVSAVPPWDSCDRMRRWAVESADSDARILQVSTNFHTEGNESFYLYYRAPEKYQAYFGFDQIFENWSNKNAFVFDLYNQDSAKYAQILMRTGSNWVWSYSASNAITTGWNTNLTFYFHSNTWTRKVWDEGITNWIYPTNMPLGGLENAQQVYIKIFGFTNEGVAYIDNIRLPP